MLHRLLVITVLICVSPGWVFGQFNDTESAAKLSEQMLETIHPDLKLGMELTELQKLIPTAFMLYEKSKESGISILVEYRDETDKLISLAGVNRDQALQTGLEAYDSRWFQFQNDKLETISWTRRLSHGESTFSPPIHRLFPPFIKDGMPRIINAPMFKSSQLILGDSDIHIKVFVTPEAVVEKVEVPASLSISVSQKTYADNFPLERVKTVDGQKAIDQLIEILKDANSD